MEEIKLCRDCNGCNKNVSFFGLSVSYDCSKDNDICGKCENFEYKFTFSMG